MNLGFFVEIETVGRRLGPTSNTAIDKKRLAEGANFRLLIEAMQYLDMSVR